MPVDRYQNSTNYKHLDESNLLNVHKAMGYNGEGKPAIRTIANAEVSARSAFGELIAVPVTPVIQIDALYEFDPREFELLTSSTGNTQQDINKTLFRAHTGTGSYGYAVIRSNRIIRYRPGQGAVCRFTAMYEQPQIGVTLRAGLLAQEQSLVVGYDGTQFGILRQNGGKAEIVKLTIASNTIGNVTINLNGTTTTVALSSTNTTSSAREIAATAFSGWLTEQIDNIVYFLSIAVGTPAGGTYTVGGTLTGTILIVQTGVANTNNWIYQSDWNIDKLDGTGESNIILDPSKLNIFQIQFRWLGAGEIRFSIENPDNGEMIFFHHIHYSNRNTSVHLDNPSFKIGYIAANLTGSTITDAHIAGASMMAGVEGLDIETSFPNSVNVTKSSLAQNTVHALITLKNKLIYRNKINLRKVKLKTLTVAYQGNDPLLIYILLNGTKSVSHTYNTVGEYSCVQKDTSIGSYTITNETPLAQFVIPINGSGTFDLNDLELTIPPGDILNIAISSAQQVSQISAATNWAEV